MAGKGEVYGTPTGSNASVGRMQDLRDRFDNSLFGRALSNMKERASAAKGAFKDGINITDPMQIIRAGKAFVTKDTSLPTDNFVDSVKNIGKELGSAAGSLASGVASATSEMGETMKNPDKGKLNEEEARTEGDRDVGRDDNGKPDEERLWDNARESLDRIQKGGGLVDDYYGSSMSDMWKNLSNDDKKILLLDQIGTSLRNAGTFRPRMGSAFGNSYEGREAGNEESMLRKGVRESFEKGLERRNERMNNNLTQQLKALNFPSELSMKAEDLITSGKITNRQKRDLTKVLATINNDTALKAALVENPTKLWEMALNAAGIAVGGVKDIAGGVAKLAL